MDSKSYVVRLVGSEERNPFKHFALLGDAMSHARSYVDGEAAERAEIYEAPGEINAYAAIGACRKSELKLIQSRGRHASQAEIETFTKRQWEEALKAGPEAALKFLGL
jgi:hypothetical protein